MIITSFTQWKNHQNTHYSNSPFYGHKDWNQHYTHTMQISSHNQWSLFLHFNTLMMNLLLYKDNPHEQQAFKLFKEYLQE